MAEILSHLDNDRSKMTKILIPLLYACPDFTCLLTG